MTARLKQWGRGWPGAFPSAPRSHMARRALVENLESRRLLVAYVLTDLGPLGGPEGGSVGLNDHGHAVLNVDVNPDPNIALVHTILYDGSKRVDLGTLGGGDTYAKGINAADQI